MQNLNELLDTTASGFGDHTAYLCEGKTWTFSQVQKEALRASSMFSQNGIKKGDRVVLLLRNSVEFIISYLGLVRLGAVAVPVNFMVQKEAELNFMFKDSGAAGAVTQKDFLASLLKARPDSMKTVWSIDSAKGRPEVLEFWPSLRSSDPSSSPKTAVSPEDTAAILYTSGTTGVPKGAMLTHENLTSNAEVCCQALEILPKDVFLCILPLFHSFAWTACILVPMRMGVKAVVVGSIAPPKPWLNLMAKHGVTIFVAIPALYSLFAKEAKGLKKLVLRWWYFRKVRMAVSGSAPLSPEVLKDFERKLRVPILEGYGLTETSPAASINRPNARKIGSVGQMLPGVEAKIVDENENELPPGEEGEVCIKGPNVMKGYFNQPEATKAAFTQDGWFKTGDIGILDSEGYLAIRDRKKDMVIVKGLKVFPAQLEAVLLSHPDVKEAAVIGVPDETGEETIKAFVTLRQDSKTGKSEILQFCRERLDPYKRPRDIEILEEMPKNALQKILKRVLRQQEIEKQKLSAPKAQAS